MLKRLMQIAVIVIVSSSAAYAQGLPYGGNWDAYLDLDCLKRFVQSSQVGFTLVCDYKVFEDVGNLYGPPNEIDANSLEAITAVLSRPLNQPELPMTVDGVIDKEYLLPKIPYHLEHFVDCVKGGVDVMATIKGDGVLRDNFGYAYSWSARLAEWAEALYANQYVGCVFNEPRRAHDIPYDIWVWPTDDCTGPFDGVNSLSEVQSGGWASFRPVGTFPDDDTDCENSVEYFGISPPSSPSLNSWMEFLGCHLPSCGGYEMIWGGVSGANSYVVEQSLDGGTSWQFYAEVGDSTHIVHGGSQTLKWRVSAKNLAGTSAPSNWAQTIANCAGGGGNW